MALQLRRGIDAQRQSLQLAPGELVYTTDTKQLYIGDGVTAGGNNVLKNVAGVGVGWNDLTQKLDFIQENLSLTTANVPEGGSGGVYFTNKRAAAAVAAALNSGGPSGITFNYNSGTGFITATATGNQIPSTVGQTGKYLTYDGNNIVWHNPPIPGGLSIPSFPGNQGSYLTTDGTNLTWALNQFSTLNNGANTVSITNGGDFAVAVSGSVKLAAGVDIKRDNGSGTYVSVLGGLLAVSGDSAPTLGGNLTLGGKNITGTGNINILGTITATSYATVVTNSLQATLGADLVLGGKNITGTGAVNITGSVTATGFSGPVTTSRLNATLSQNLQLNGNEVVGTGRINVLGNITALGNSTIRGGNLLMDTNTSLLGGIAIESQHDVNSSSDLFTIRNYQSTDAFGAIVNFARSRGTKAAPLPLINGDQILNLAYQSGFADGSYAVVALTGAQIVGTPNAGTASASYYIATSNGDQIPTVKLSIGPDGKHTITAPALVAGGGTGQVNTGSVATYMRVNFNGTEYAMPMYAIRP